MTPRLVTDMERGMTCPEKVMLVMEDDWIWCGVPTSMTSVLELFNCRKLCFVHSFISSRQVVRVDSGDGAGEVAEGRVSIFMYSCVSSA